MDIPITFLFFGKETSVHIILETLAFIIAFRYYVFLRKKTTDNISSINRLFIVLAATIGALVGSRLLGALENPEVLLSGNFICIYRSKTIIGGLIGGLFAVEFAKYILKEKQSSGDLFVLPLILGIFIGRIGCFLTGTLEPTYGIETKSIFGMNLGDGLLRHPTALYEIIFLLFLFFFIKKLFRKPQFKSGTLFKFFMIEYFLFRFFIEFIKPNTFFVSGLSTIQLTCVFCFLYYYKVFIKPKSLFL